MIVYVYFRFKKTLINLFFVICRLNEQTLMPLSLKRKFFPLIFLEKMRIVSKRKILVGAK